MAHLGQSILSKKSQQGLEMGTSLRGFMHRSKPMWLVQHSAKLAMWDRGIIRQSCHFWGDEICVALEEVMHLRGKTRHRNKVLRQE